MPRTGLPPQFGGWDEFDRAVRVLTGLGVNSSAQSVRGNLIWTPLTGFDVGAELMFGERELESGVSGDMTRLSLFAKYGF